MGRRRDSDNEITPELLLRAYAAGIFPMAESADDPALYWVEPRERGIIPLDGFHVSSRLARTVRSDIFEIRIDTDFDGVIAGCAAPAEGRRQTWINGRIRELYGALFDAGHAHTVEAWLDGRLVGGLYGVRLGAAFFGESMFHTARDASKVALVHLVARLRAGASGCWTPSSSPTTSPASARSRCRARPTAPCSTPRPRWTRTSTPGRRRGASPGPRRSPRCRTEPAGNRHARNAVQWPPP